MLYRHALREYHTCKAVGTRCFLFPPPDSEQEDGEDDWPSLMVSSILRCLPSRASTRVEICPSIEFICVNCPSIKDWSVCKTSTKEVVTLSTSADTRRGRTAARQVLSRLPVYIRVRLSR